MAKKKKSRGKKGKKSRGSKEKKSSKKSSKKGEKKKRSSSKKTVAPPPSLGANPAPDRPVTYVSARAMDDLWETENDHGLMEADA